MAEHNNNGHHSNQDGRWWLPFGRQNDHNNGGPPRRGNGRYAHITGWGMAVPKQVLTNHDLEAIVETNDDWIRTRTGISERRIADEKESTGNLALGAAQKALKVAGLLPTDIDLIIVATSTPEHIFPSTASQVQDWLGAINAGAYDLSAACSGFVYGLDMASAKIRAGDINHALVIGAETMSRVLNWADRGTCILFGDGAGAVVLSATNEVGGVLSSILRSDGSGRDVLGLPTVGSGELCLTSNGFEPQEDKNPPLLMHRLHMKGRDVFRFATRVINESIKQAVQMAGLELEDIDLIVPHQANQRILESASRNLKIPVEKFYSNVARYGNTSAASIPSALCEAIQDKKVHKGQNLVFIGFGGGLTWATMVLQWETATELDKRPSTMSLRRKASYWYQIQRRRFQRWRRKLSNRLAGDPMPDATLRHLDEQLERKKEPEKN